MPKTKLKDPPDTGAIICRIDGLILKIGSTDQNCDFIARDFTGFLENLSVGFTGRNEYQGPQYHGKDRQYNQNSVYNFRSEVSQIKILFHSWLTPFIKQNGRTPNARELRRLRAEGSKILFLAKIEITNTQKLDYLGHMRNIYTGIQLLEHLDMSISKIEIALDTNDEGAAEFIRKYTCLKKGPSYSQVFYCPGDDEEKKIDGPSPDGNKEYHGYRAKSRDAKPDRPEGGRKQLYSYMRDVDGSDNTFQRVELRLYRLVAKKLRLQYGPSVFDVVLNIENILRDCICFKRINLNNLYLQRPLAKTLALTNLSTKGQIYRLQQGRYQFPKSFVDRYLEEFKWPSIYFPSFPIEYTEENAMGRALQD